jgi:hypothetical protein
MNTSAKCLAYNVSMNHFKTFEFDKLELHAQDCRNEYGIVCQVSKVIQLK